MDFSAYEKGNPFMSYNHIQICKVDPDCCVVKVNLVAESMNLHGHVHGGLLYAMADCVAGIFARMGLLSCDRDVFLNEDSGYGFQDVFHF